MHLRTACSVGACGARVACNILRLETPRSSAPVNTTATPRSMVLPRPFRAGPSFLGGAASRRLLSGGGGRGGWGTSGGLGSDFHKNKKLIYNNQIAKKSLSRLEQRQGKPLRHYQDTSCRLQPRQRGNSHAQST